MMTDVQMIPCPDEDCDGEFRNESGMKSHFSRVHGPPYPWDNTNAGYGPRWEKKREEVLIRDQHTCQVCLTPEDETWNKTLYVHHIKGKDRDNAHDAGNLVSVCSRCHTELEDLTIAEQYQVILKLDGVDGKILNALLDGRDEDQPWGRNTPKNLAEELGYSRQHMNTRLNMLEAADAVQNIGGGVYEFVEDPREERDQE